MTTQPSLYRGLSTLLLQRQVVMHGVLPPALVYVVVSYLVAAGITRPLLGGEFTITHIGLQLRAP